MGYAGTLPQRLGSGRNPAPIAVLKGGSRDGGMDLLVKKMVRVLAALSMAHVRDLVDELIFELQKKEQEYFEKVRDNRVGT